MARHSLALAIFLVLCGLPLADAAPDNDDFQNRFTAAGTNALLQVYQLDATREPGEPPHCTEPLTGYASVWWTWTAPAAGLVTISTDQGEPNRWVTIYRGGTVSDLTYLGSGIPRSYSNAVFRVQSGRNYQFAFSWPGAAPSEAVPPYPVNYRLQFFEAPVNDNFENRIRLTGERVILEGHTVGATHEAGEPTPFGLVPETVWWEWTPPLSGLVWFDGDFGVQANFRPYFGTQLADLQPIPLTNDWAGFQVEGGRPLQISFSPTYRAGAGPFSFRFVLSALQVQVSATDIPAGEEGTITFQVTGAPPDVSAILMREISVYEFPIVNSAITLSNLNPGLYEIRPIGLNSVHNEFYAPRISFSVGSGADQFAQAREAQPGTTVLGGDFTRATLETGEPAVPADSSGTVWWRWRAPSRGLTRFDATTRDPFPPPPQMEVFAGDTLEALTPVPPVEGYGVHAILAEREQTYWFRLRQARTSPGWGALKFQFFPQVPNDAFASAEVVPPQAWNLEVSHEFLHASQENQAYAKAGAAPAGTASMLRARAISGSMATSGRTECRAL
jgi:hypothetical protein